MRSRFPGPVMTLEVVDSKQFSRAWVKTSGGGTPVIDNSYGVSSITDAGVGLLDVTWTTAFGSAECIIHAISQDTNARDSAFIKTSQSTPPTATTCRLTCVDNGAILTDVAGGWYVVAYGI